MDDILLFAVGVLVGAMNAIAGGGSMIGFPVLLAAGLSPLTANATTYLSVLPGNITSAYAYRKYIRRVPRQYLLLLIPTVVGGIVGATALRNTTSANFESFAPALILAAVVLFAFQPFLYQYLHQHLIAPKRVRQRLQPLLLVSLAVFPLSIYGGYFGAGFGFIMLAFLGFTRLHDHIHRMNALKNITTFFISGTTLIILLGSGLISWRHGLVMAAGNLLGGYYGAIGTMKVSSHAIRILIIAIGAITAVYLGLRSY